MRIIMVSVPIWLILAGNGLPQSCPAPRADHGAVIEIPVRFSFRDAAYNQQWIFDTLEPRLSDNNKSNRTPNAVFETVRDGKYEQTFCWDMKDVNEQPPTLEYTFATHDARFTPRPIIKWEQRSVRADKDGKTKTYSYGSTGTVDFEYPNAPDWLILKSATWAIDVEGHPLLEIELFNSRAVEDAGGEVELLLSNQARLDRCRARVPPIEVPVTFVHEACRSASLGKHAGGPNLGETCGLTVATPDPGDKRAIRRRFEFTDGPCGELDASLVLGPTGSLPPGSFTKLRYVFSEKMKPTQERPTLSKTGDPDIQFLYSLEHRFVGIGDTSIYPPSWRKVLSQTDIANGVSSKRTPLR